MRASVAELLCCPRCAHGPLELAVAELSASGTAAEEVEEGSLRCGGCDADYRIEQGIARVAAVTGVSGASPSEDELAEREASILRRAALVRPDAGNRSYTRELTIFSRLRPRVTGGGAILLEVGCGEALSVRALCPPEQVGCRYVGTDSSLTTLLVNRRTMEGDWVHCAEDALPFRPQAVDAAISLGSLSPLGDPNLSLRRMLAIVRPGGVAGWHELLGRRGFELAQLREVLAEEAARGVLRLEFSPLRWVLARALRARMRSSPRLTRLVIGLDTACIRTLGRATRFFSAREALVFAQKR